MLAAIGAVFQMKQAVQDATSESLSDMWPICRRETWVQVCRNWLRTSCQIKAENPAVTTPRG